MTLTKKRLEDLAIFGGSPAFADKLHVGRPNIGNRAVLLRRFNEMLDRRWLSNDGPFVQELERKLATYLGVKHCVVVCNATLAIELTAEALGLHGEVILPSFTFVATAHALQWHRITPVFCDVDPGTHNIDPDEVEKLITPQTTGILGVHVWGRGCDVERLAGIAAKHGLRLIFDAAHALACTHRGILIGAFGDAEIFSFHAAKFFNTFEGGAVTTNDDELAGSIRRLRNFGFTGLDQVVGLGTNAKMSEVSGLMGLTSLESLDDFVAVNRRNHGSYAKYLEHAQGIRLIAYDADERNNYQYVVVEVDARSLGITRDLFVETLRAENVLARRYFFPGCHRMEPYCSLFPHAGDRLPKTEILTRTLMQLPTGTAVGTGDISAVCEIINFIRAHGAKIAGRIQRERRFPPS